ncbi:MAG: hypothetical protein IKJ84_05070 [Oscillospiraceae bacterium]|nr:hypothetical protein [Oscillospiraceae bacterium]
MRTKSLITQALFAKEGCAYKAIRLPHTWNNLDGQDGGADYWRGIGTYQLQLPDPTDGKRQYIEIQGANHVATVYCNGRELGTHKGGFSTFRFELTKAMKKTGNTLTVSVSNAVSDIYPQQADFTFFGGLYRDVHFIEVENAHFDLLKDGSDAVFVTPYSSGTTRVDLFPTEAEGCTVVAELKDADGNVVATGNAPAQTHTVLKLKVKDPHLWNGMADPYCYSCEARILKDEDTVDAVSVTYGYRSFHVDANTGFWLNGKSVPLRGVARHQDRQDKGWAVSREDHEEDIALIKEIGANTIRLAHYQHDQYFYDLCDRTGFAVWAEIPFISRFIPSQEAHDNTVSQMTELVAQNYNHPSILFWGLSNEITIAGESEALYRNLAELNALVKKMDPHRLTTMACVGSVAMNSELVYLSDLISYNNYFGWYVGDVEDNGPWLDRFHQLNPSTPIGLAEYGADMVTKWHTAYPENHDYTEEYGCYYHQEMLKCFAERPYLWATHCWNMFDFAADARNEGGVMGCNIKGLMTYDHKQKKDAFYVYKAWWNPEPMIHISGERFADRAPGERNITVYTNCDTVTLWVNGTEAATKQAQDHQVIFEDVPMAEGKNTIRATCGEVASQTVVLNAVPTQNYSYILPDGNAAANWFEDPAAVHARRPFRYVEGHFSIKDKMDVLLGNASVMEAVGDTLNQLLVGGKIDLSIPAMVDALSMLRLTDLLSRASRTMKEINQEYKHALNDKLSQIRK